MVLKQAVLAAGFHWADQHGDVENDDESVEVVGVVVPYETTPIKPKRKWYRFLDACGQPPLRDFIATIWPKDNLRFEILVYGDTQENHRRIRHLVKTIFDKLQSQSPKATFDVLICRNEPKKEKRNFFFDYWVLTSRETQLARVPNQVSRDPSR